MLGVKADVPPTQKRTPDQCSICHLLYLVGAMPHPEKDFFQRRHAHTVALNAQLLPLYTI